MFLFQQPPWDPCLLVRLQQYCFIDTLTSRISASVSRFYFLPCSASKWNVLKHLRQIFCQIFYVEGKLLPPHFVSLFSGIKCIKYAEKERKVYQTKLDTILIKFRKSLTVPMLRPWDGMWWTFETFLIMCTSLIHIRIIWGTLCRV